MTVEAQKESNKNRIIAHYYGRNNIRQIVTMNLVNKYILKYLHLTIDLK